MEEEESKGEKGLQVNDYVVGSLRTVIYIPNFITESEQSQLLRHIYEVPASRWKSLKNRRLQNWGGVVHEKGLLPQACEWRTFAFTLLWLFCICAFRYNVIKSVISSCFSLLFGVYGPAYFPVVAILSLESPITIDFTPHPRSKEFEMPVENEDSTVYEAVSGQIDSPSTESTGSPKDEHHQSSVLLMPCSLLIFKDQAYTDYLHGIEDSESLSLDKVVNISEVIKLKELEYPRGSLHAVTSDVTQDIGQNNIFQRTSTRVSLTCRLVLKVHKNLFKF
ncbi:unnamed protein product [Musa acuminata subsp. burmannicoides]